MAPIEALRKADDGNFPRNLAGTAPRILMDADVEGMIGATWQRGRVHFARDALAHVPRGQHDMVVAAIRQAFIQPGRKSAGETWRHLADQLRARWPKLGALIDGGSVKRSLRGERS